MYLLFCFDTYYPGGGWKDFKGVHMSLEAAKDAARSSGFDKYHIVANMEIVDSKEW